MANTSAFSMRRKNKDLRANYSNILHKLAESSKKKSEAYKNYLIRLNEVLPRSEEYALPAAILAARLSQDEEEQKSICKSILSLAANAELLRTNLKYFGEEWCFNVALPDLYMTDVPITRHFAELDEAGNIIRQWDTTSTETRYYLKKEG